MARLRCDICGLEHDRRAHQALRIRELDVAALRADHERHRRSKIAAAKLTGDRVRSRRVAVAPRAAAPTKSRRVDSCAICVVGSLHAQLPWCEKCAVTKGYQRCVACGQLTKPSKVSPVRCGACKPKPMCADCGRLQPIKKSRWCHRCSLRNGWKVCSSCSKPFKPSVRDSRRRRCPKCVENYSIVGPRGQGPASAPSRVVCLAWVDVEAVSPRIPVKQAVLLPLARRESVLAPEPPREVTRVGEPACPCCGSDGPSPAGEGDQLLPGQL